MRKKPAQNFLKQFIKFMLQQFLCNDARVEVIDNPVSVYKVGGGYTIQAKRFLNLRCLIKANRKGDIVSFYEIFHFFFGIIDSNSQKHHAFWLIVADSFLKDRHLFPAWQAPGSEEIDQYWFSLMLAELKTSAVKKRKREIWGMFLGLR